MLAGQARRDALAKRARLRQPPAAADPRGGLNPAAAPDQLLSMLNQLTPDRRQRAVDYVAQLLELQRAQDGPQAGANRGRRMGGPGGLNNPPHLAAAAPLKPALHVSGHMPGYNAAAEPADKLVEQVAQLSETLSRLQPPHQQEALDHMVGHVFPQAAAPVQTYPPQMQPPSRASSYQPAANPPQWPPPPPQWPQAPPSQSQWPQPPQPLQPHWQRPGAPQQPQWPQQPAASENVYSMAHHQPAAMLQLQQPSPNKQPGYGVERGAAMRSTEVQWANVPGPGAAPPPGLQGPRPPPVSLERQSSDMSSPPRFMRALGDMHCGTSPQQMMAQEQRKQEWLKQLEEQLEEQKARKAMEQAQIEQSKLIDEDEWRQKGMHTWWGKEGAGAPLRRDGVVVADLKSGQAIPPADAFKPMGKSLADQPIGGGGSYVAGGGAKRGGGGGGGGGPAVRRGPGP